MPTPRKPAPPPLTLEQKQLVADHYRLAISLAWPFRKAYPRWDAELISAAGCGLIRAALVFDPVAGKRFDKYVLAYVTSRLRWTCGDLIRADKRSRDFAAAAYDSASGSRSSYTQFQLAARDHVERLLDVLPGPYRLLMRELYLAERTGREVAEEWGMSEAWLSSARSHALRLMRNAAADLK